MVVKGTITYGSQSGRALDIGLNAHNTTPASSGYNTRHRNSTSISRILKPSSNDMLERWQAGAASLTKYALPLTVGTHEASESQKRIAIRLATPSKTRCRG